MPDDPLRLLAAEPEQAAVLLDVDGTLAPIADRPDDAHVPEETRDELARLAARYALVACVSGRPRSEVERMVGVAGVAIVGEHGLELEPEAAAWAGRIAEFARGVDWPAERKPLSVSFHFRRADDEAAARAYLTRVAAAAATEGLVPRWGRMVLEVRPPVDAHKGTAVRALVARAGARRALYAGDDRTDLDAFGGLDGLELGIRVAVRSPEAPPELLAAADVVVDGTDGMLALLRRL
jgi:trehalose 6-phosphate phosphatase